MGYRKFDYKLRYYSFDLAKIMGNDFDNIRNICISGVTYYLALDVCDMLEIKNTSYAMKHYVKSINRTKCCIDEVNKRCRVHFITESGIVDLLSNKSTLKNIILLKRLQSKLYDAEHKSIGNQNTSKISTLNDFF